MRLIRISSVLSLLAAAFFGTLLFWTSQSVQQAEDELGRVTLAKEREEESIRVLQTEWDYLTSPARLERLADDYLRLEAVKGKQIADDMAAIPKSAVPIVPGMKPARPMPVSMKAEAAPAPVVQENSREDFDALLEKLEGGQR